MRTIGEVLTNNTDKPLSNPLFGAIIKQTGYCNGSELLTVFHYLKSTTLSFIYDDLRTAIVFDKVFKSNVTLSIVPVSNSLLQISSHFSVL
jgi:hypothetical protein